MTEPSSFWDVVSTKERIWLGWTGVFEDGSVSGSGHVKAPVEGMREKTSPVAPPAE